MSRRAIHPDDQLELPLSSVLSHALFPGRSALLVAEIAAALRCTEQHVLNLCEDGTLAAIDIRTGQAARPRDYARNRSARRCLRVPVSSYDRFIAASAAPDLPPKSQIQNPKP